MQYTFKDYLRRQGYGKWTLSKNEKNEFKDFKDRLQDLKSKIPNLLNEREEELKSLVRDCLSPSYDYTIKCDANNIDMVIRELNNNENYVLCEFKKIGSSDMITPTDLNRKALQQLLYYYLEELDKENDKVKYLIVTDYKTWFIFDAIDFNKAFYSEKLWKDYLDFKKNKLQGNDTAYFYKAYASKYISTTIQKGEFPAFAYGDLSKIKTSDYETWYRILSPTFLFKNPIEHNANVLNKKFYDELLYILGLKEEKIDNQLVIVPNGVQNTIVDCLCNTLSKDEDTAFVLMTTWLNRILFIKLLEGLILDYDSSIKKFFDKSIIKHFSDVNNLFFEVLAKPIANRDSAIQTMFKDVPYLNSSLFDTTKEEQTCQIKALHNNVVKVYDNSILKKTDKKLKSLNLLDYLLDFLNAYDFRANQEDSKDTIITAPVLGLIFEKLNGHKDGAIFTPSFITTNMSKWSITETIIKKFNEHYAWSCSCYQELLDKVDEHFSEIKDYEERLKKRVEDVSKLIYDIKLCDPAVGSGHYLISAMNELLIRKVELCGGLFDEHCNRIRDLNIVLDGDELCLFYQEVAFRYNKEKSNLQNGLKDKCQDIQEAMFREKQMLIENCLYGVDINPTSVKICQLRLWIELLKSAYYNVKTNELETLPNIDANIRQGNSLLSAFPIKPTTTNHINIKLKGVKSAYKTEQDYHQRIYESLGQFLSTTIGVNSKGVSGIRTYKNMLIQYKQSKDKANTQKLKGQIEKFRELLNQHLIGIVQHDLIEGITSKHTDGTKKYLSNILALLKLDSFEWLIEFPELINENNEFKGFDLVIGNPPYIRIQGLQSYSPELCKAYSQNYKSAIGSYDIYVLFMERGLDLIKDNGEVSYILPHKFLTADFGKGIRATLCQETTVKELLHFGSENIFNGVSTYTCIVRLDKTNKSELYFKRIKPSQISQKIKWDSIDYNNLNTQSWDLIDDDVKAIFDKIKEHPYKVEDVFDSIFQGIATSLDKVYVFNGIDKGTYIQAYNEDYDYYFDIEKDLVKPLLRGKDIERYEELENSKYVFFPYESNGTPVKEDYIKKNLPKTYDYIKHFEEEIRGREKGKMDIKEGWFLYIYPKNITKFNQPKIMTQEISLGSNMTYDDKGQFYHLTTVYSFVKNPKFNVDDKFYLAIMNSNLMWFFIKHTSSELQGGCFRFQTKYLKPFPLPRIPRNAQDFIDLVDEIFSLKQKLKDESFSNKYLQSVINMFIANKEERINKLVYALYGLNKEDIAVIEQNI